MPRTLRSIHSIFLSTLGPQALVQSEAGQPRHFPTMRDFRFQRSEGLKFWWRGPLSSKNYTCPIEVVQIMEVFASMYRHLVLMHIYLDSQLASHGLK